MGEKIVSIIVPYINEVMYIDDIVYKYTEGKDVRIARFSYNLGTMFYYKMYLKVKK